MKLVRICQVLLNEQKAKTMVLDFDKIESLVGTMSHPLLNGTNLTYDRLSIPLDTKVECMGACSTTNNCPHFFFCHPFFSDKSIFLSKYIVLYALSRPIDYLTFKFTF